ncbi:MAG: carbohydrate deacetylase [Gemmatimonadales bacterium]
MGAGPAASGRRLVVNADDLGLSILVNEGIEEAVRAGAVTSASLMVNTPGFDDAVRRAHALGPKLGVGLHFNLTTGASVAPAASVPSLVDGAGRFLSLKALLQRALGGGVRAQDVRVEAEAQFARLRAAGIAPTHADSHRHVHAFPAMRGALAAAAAVAGVRFVRRPIEPLWARPRGAAGVMKRALLAAAWAAPSAGPRPVPGTTSFRGIALLGSPSFETDLVELLDNLPDGSTELMVHPGKNDPSVAAWDPYIAERAVELAALLSAPVQARLARADLALTRFGAG